MEDCGIAHTVSWAFGAPPEEGVPALEKVASACAFLDTVDLRNGDWLASAADVSEMDARDVMSSLVAADPQAASPAQLALYVVIVSRVFVGLCIDTAARKQRLLKGTTSAGDGCGVEDAVEAARTTMRAWARDLVPLLVLSVLPQLCLRDAEAHTVTTSQHVPSVAAAVDVNDVTSPAMAAAESESAEQDQLLLEAVRKYDVATHLVRLVCSLHAATFDATMCPLLLATYAALHHMDEYPADGTVSAAQQGGETAVLRAWRQRFLREVGGVSAAAGASTAPPIDGTEGENTAAVPPSDTAAAALRRLLDTAVSAGTLPGWMDVWSFAVAQVMLCAAHSARDAALFAADVERGAAPPDTTAAALAKEREDEVAACTLIPTDGVDGEGLYSHQARDACVHASLTRQGSLLLVADVVRGGSDAASALLSVSSFSLLLLVADAFAVALTSASRSALMRHLLFLHDLLQGIPRYSIDCTGERRSSGSAAAVCLDDGVADTDFGECQTKRYEALFTMEKELLSVSALCPSDEHRRAARCVALELLERLREEPRVRMHLSLLTLCPYASIARFFLERMLEDWRGDSAGEAGRGARSTGAVACLVPRGLASCMVSFLDHVGSGSREFLDALIVCLNFVRVETSRREWIRAVAAGKLQVPERAERCAAQSWGYLLHRLRQEIVPRCAALTEIVGQPAPTLFARPPLSPLDAFSLSCAVEGVTTLFSSE